MKGLSRAQVVGLLLSYMRRFTLSAELGIVQEDNDANGHNDDSGHDSNGSTTKQPAQTQAANPTQKASTPTQTPAQTQQKPQAAPPADYLKTATDAIKAAKSIPH